MSTETAPPIVDAPDLHVVAPVVRPSLPVFDVEDLSVSYGDTTAVAGVDLRIDVGQITAFIGPSGCGKTSVLRCLNRMNDVVAGARVRGSVLHHGVDLYAPDVDAVEVRRRIGMVFQKPNPFAKSIYDNVAFGPRVAGRPKSELPEVVERSLRRAALWDEVKDRLRDSARGLSGGQQQRLCIARALAVDPAVILMDEPCSALDPIATRAIEELMAELRHDVTIVIVTHNMQQAARVSDRTAFFSVVELTDGARQGVLVETGATAAMFEQPTDERTHRYVTGQFG